MRLLQCLPITLLVSLPSAPSVAAQEPERVSSFGEYEGYSEARFDGWSTTSRYVAMRDGVRLAVDVTRPTVGGAVTEEKLPVVWTHSRYHRNPKSLVTMFGGDGSRIDSSVDVNPGLQRLVRHGYVVASVGVRGSGASFGRFEGLFSEAETLDAVELIEWFAAQPWSDGNVGMFGGSYLGITQYMAASKAPEALKAICPDVAAFDMFEILYPGGIFRDDLLRHWDGLTDELDSAVLAPPVSADAGGELRKKAVAEHAKNWQVFDGYRSVPFRDQSAPGIDWSKHGPAPFLKAIDEAAIPTYHMNGWLDVFSTDTCIWFANLTGPQKMLMGEWGHAEVTPARARLMAVEMHRWYDRWLKGIKNGVEDEPRIHYAVTDEPGDVDWHSADAWPVEGTRELELFLADDDTPGDLTGTLRPAAPDNAAAVAYDIDQATTTGSSSRWDNAVGAARAGVRYDLASNDAKALTFTTETLEDDLTVVGHPVVTLQATASAGDADFYFVLEEVAGNGGVRYVTEGIVRGSMRKTSQPPFDNLGLPWHRCFAEDASPMPSGTPTAVMQDLHPVGAVFNAGHRLRLSIFCADRDNAEAPKVELPASIAVHCGGPSPSSIRLPVR